MHNLSSKRVTDLAYLKIKLDEETLSALKRRSEEEYRNPDAEALVLLRRSLGLPVPSGNLSTHSVEERQRDE